VTGIGGGTIRDLLLNIHPILWIEHPSYLAVCIAVSLVAFFTAHRAHSRMRLILWADAIGLALFATVGAERAVSVGASPLVAIVMGVITACFGGIVRDLLSHTRSIIFSYEIYVTAAMGAATMFVILHFLGLPREVDVIGGGRHRFRAACRRTAVGMVTAPLPPSPAARRSASGRCAPRCLTGTFDLAA
jgi:Predicted membrane protein